MRLNAQGITLLNDVKYSEGLGIMYTKFDFYETFLQQSCTQQCWLMLNTFDRRITHTSFQLAMRSLGRKGVHHANEGGRKLTLKT